jgi:hypothetical protein
VLTRIDHLVYTADSLKRGMDKMELLLGIRPVLGGRHLDFGTHNALLSLGPNTYLEIIARDPDVPIPASGLPFGLDRIQNACLSTWAFRSESIEDQSLAAKQHGVDLGSIERGSRKKHDGSALSWKLTDPRAMILNGAMPFLISWGDAPHPACDIPRAGKLIGFRIEHPDPGRVNAALKVLGIEFSVRSAENMRLFARIQTTNGIIDL